MLALGVLPMGPCLTVHMLLVGPIISQAWTCTDQAYDWPTKTPVGLSARH